MITGTTFVGGMRGPHGVNASWPLARLTLDATEGVVVGLLRMLTETIASGHGSRPNNDVQNVAGMPPISFADFARRTAQARA